MPVDIVVPTIGRASLATLLASLDRARGPRPRCIILVDDRKDDSQPLATGTPSFADRIRIVRGGARGPAAARNTGWRHSGAEWIAFLDDDVLVEDDWFDRLECDLARLSAAEAGSQGRVRVPLPEHRRATDWERNVAGLETSAWITADMAYRRSVLEQTGGFDERFPRAYREDSDFALRVFAAGYSIARGERRILHPVRNADRWVSVRLQAGNADDALMRALHGRHWRRLARAGNGRLRAHAFAVACAAGAVAASAVRKWPAAALFAAGWIGATAEFAWRRIAPGPRTADEVLTMCVTSAAIPFAAIYHRARGEMR